MKGPYSAHYTYITALERNVMRGSITADILKGSIHSIIMAVYFNIIESQALQRIEKQKA